MADSANRQKELFLKALDLSSPTDRAAFLTYECGGNEALRRHIDAMLAAHAKPDSFLEKPAAAMGATVDASNAIPLANVLPNEYIGTRIGPYKLLEPIGEGGMGVVFMAEQQEPVRRLVALKIIKPGMDSGQVLARFEAERQALAMMDHPNIAKVLDAGTTSGEPGGVSPGRPYFVMELVKGTPITTFCDANKLSPRHRLELFVRVCQAIQHAHQKGIIHRDIKPSNVLIALYDDEPVPKVIDFGIAKAAGQALTDRTLQTGFGAIVGTLEYMSPEQTKLNQLDVDTRSDIYSLGVLLYELLTGSTPLGRERIKERAILEVLRLIHEEEPARPSVKLSSNQGRASISTHGSEPEKLSRLLRGELDWIVMKSLEKDRNRRYDTAASLARDVERYLKDELVEARPPSLSYRVRKAIRKHRGPVIAASLVLLALIGGVIGTTTAMFRAREAEGKTRTANETIEANLTEVKQLNEKLTNAMSAVGQERDRATDNEKAAQKAFADAQRLAEKLKVEQREREADIERSIPAFVRSAKLLAHSGDLTEALRQIELTLFYQPDHAEARLFKGMLLIGRKEFAAGHEEMQRYLKLAPKDADAGQFARLCAPGHADDLKFRLALAAVFSRQQQPVLAARVLEDKRGDKEARQKLLAQYKNILEKEWRYQVSLTMASDTSFILELSDAPPGRIQSLAPLKGMQIEHLSTSKGLPIKDLSPLEGMPLVLLRLMHCVHILDYSPIKGMPLNHLDLEGTNVRDLNMLQGMKTLRHLDLKSCRQLKDLTGLQGLKLTFLDLSGCWEIKNLSPLKGLPLEFLDLKFCGQIDKLAPLEGMPLTSLDLSGLHRLRDLAPLRGMPLKKLNLTCYFPSQLRDLGPLADVKELEDLNLFANQGQVSDLKPLKGLPLKYLNIHGTSVRSLEPLKGTQLIRFDWSLHQFNDENVNILRAMNTLQTIWHHPNEYSPVDFFRRYDAGQWKKK